MNTPKPRDAKVEEILSAMDNWDEETLLAWAKDVRRDMLDRCSDVDIQRCWEEDCNEDCNEDQDES